MTYVSNSGNGTVDVIDTASETLVTSVAGFECSIGIAIVNVPPGNKDDCKDGGYKRFNSPAFRNQGQCVKYVNEHSK